MTVPKEAFRNKYAIQIRRIFEYFAQEFAVGQGSHKYERIHLSLEDYGISSSIYYRCKTRLKINIARCNEQSA